MKKIIPLVLVGFMVVVVLPVYAQTATYQQIQELTAALQKLEEQTRNLQNQLAQTGFQRNLYFGLSNDPDVLRLQEFLRGLGFFTFPKSTGNFFAATREAVIKFQNAYTIRPTLGYFGPLSRQKANQILAARQGLSLTLLLTPIQSATSSYQGKITLSSISGKSNSPRNERITITNKTKNESIDITGWTLRTSGGNTFQIPMVYNLPGVLNPSLERLILPSQGRVEISAGRQEQFMNFRENVCTGYFSQSASFRPFSLSRSCPRPDTRTLLHFEDRCLKLIEKTALCRTPTIPPFSGISNDCAIYLNANLNYSGCVNNYRSLNGFYKNRWLIWMQKTDEFLRNTHDTVTLKDNLGKIVDQKSY